MIAYGRDLLANRATTRLEGYYFSAIFDSLLTISTSFFHIWKASPARVTRGCNRRELSNVDRNLYNYPSFVVVFACLCIMVTFQKTLDFIARSFQLILLKPYVSKLI